MCYCRHILWKILFVIYLKNTDIFDASQKFALLSGKRAVVCSQNKEHQSAGHAVLQAAG